MRLSESLRKGIMETSSSGLFNKFKMRKRRNVLFFNDILMEYVRECEKAGFGDDIRELSEKWGISIFERLVPGMMKMLPFNFLCNKVLAPVWKNLGYMEDILFKRNADSITIITKNETNIQRIGLNNLSIGFYMGMVGSICQRRAHYVDADKSGSICTYRLRLSDSLVSINLKEKDVYDRLNLMPAISGFTLKDALRKGIFQLKEYNKIYFRGRLTSPGDSTILQLIGNSGPKLNSIQSISYAYFRDIIEKDSSSGNKIVLLKTLLQVMGQGIVTIVTDGGNIMVNIKNPVYGFQAEPDNWEFLTRTILGYLWMIKRNLGVKDVEIGHKHLKITYS